MLPLLYEYPYDLTPYVSVIKKQTVGEQPTAEFAEVMATVTGDPWTTEPKKAYTVYNAKVGYVGNNLTGFPTSKRFTSVIKITLSVRYKTRDLYFVFNEL